MKRQPDHKDPPDWNSFETWKGPAPRELPPWLDRGLRGILCLAGLAILFALSGGMLLFMVDQIARGLARRFDIGSIPRPAALWTAFVLGGLAGTIPVIRWWFRAQKESIQRGSRKRR
jgi:hypothetical protein